MSHQFVIADDVQGQIKRNDDNFKILVAEPSKEFDFFFLPDKYIFFSPLPLCKACISLLPAVLEKGCVLKY